MKKKNIALLVSVALLLCAAIGGTLAWLTAKTEAVTNTFAPSTISIELKETTPSETDRTNIKMVPGAEIAKDPKVTVGANSEACYLYIKVEASPNAATFLTYALADGWTAVDGHTGYYRREVASSTTAQEFPILAGNKVTVNGTITSDDMATIADAANRPTLSFKAAAIQKDYITEADIWGALPAEFKA